MSLTVNSGADLSALFSSLNKNNDVTASLISDYASIKNGSYGKLVKAYYSKKSSDSETGEVSKKDKFSESLKGDVKNEKNAASAATSLSSAATALYSNKSMFEKTKIKDTDGNETEDYDWNAISDKVKSFVSSYNNTLKMASASDSTGVLSSTLNMVKSTAANVNQLSAVGIKLGTDNKLSFDEEQFKKSDIADVKSLFSGVGSYAYNVSNSSASIANKATNAASMYNAAGSYQMPTAFNNVMDQYF